MRVKKYYPESSVKFTRLNPCKRVWFFIFLSGVAFAQPRIDSQYPHYLVDNKGNPLFLIGDTGWDVIISNTREDIVHYLDVRKKQGFNTILFKAFNSHTNSYGDYPFKHTRDKKYDVSAPLVTKGNSFDSPDEYDYWDHVDFFIDLAEKEDFYLMFLPSWGNFIVGGFEGQLTREMCFNETNAYQYARWIADRYQNKSHIFWVMNGDRLPYYGPDKDYIPVINAFAEGIADGTNGVNNQDGQADYSTTLMTYHPMKEWDQNRYRTTNSSEWFHTREWLDFNSVQENAFKAIISIINDFYLYPSKPVFLYEGRYEDHNPSLKAWGVRVQSYQSVFSGGFSIVYGHENIFKFPTFKGRDWKADLLRPGAEDMKHLGSLMQQLTKEQFLSRIPNQNILVGDQGTCTWNNDYSHASNRITATTDMRGSFALIYSANGRIFSVNTKRLGAYTFNAFWFNPRNGMWHTSVESASETKTAFQSDISGGVSGRFILFDPPGEAFAENDWVLFLEGE